MPEVSSLASSPRVSVIIIFFDAEAFFEEAIESVLAQDYRDFELLLVDDGSTDASTEIAKDYERRYPTRIHCLEHPDHANRGMSATRNLGVEAARGELVAFLDSDDRWAPSKLFEQVEILDRHADVDAVCGTARYWRSWEGGRDRLVPSGHAQNRPVRPPEAILSVYPLGSANAPCPSDLLIRRSAVLGIGGFEEAFRGMYEDQAFLTKLYLERTIYFADKVWIDYRLHDQSCCAQVKRAGQHQDVRRQFLEWLEAHLARSSYRGDLRIRMALTRARLRHRFPYVERMLGVPMRVIRRLSAA